MDSRLLEPSGTSVAPFLYVLERGRMARRSRLPKDLLRDTSDWLLGYSCTCHRCLIHLAELRMGHYYHWPRQDDSMLQDPTARN